MPRILNLGSLNIDHVYRMERSVTSGETLGSAAYSRGAGSKELDQSIALARADAEVRHAGCLGREAHLLRELLLAERSDTARLRAVEQPAGHAIIQVDAAGRDAISRQVRAWMAAVADWSDERRAAERERYAALHRANELAVGDATGDAFP